MTRTSTYVSVPGERFYGIGVAVKLLRTALGFSQRQLAAAIGNVPRTYISKIEQHRATPNLSSIERFANIFGITPYGLIRIAEEIQ
ncbi:MAG: helix-turn-helix domain-containing protein [Acidobacteriota bacterium]|nr:helix-turn-helix domain-containing protein [Acidobacteriota bacterium]